MPKGMIIILTSREVSKQVEDGGLISIAPCVERLQNIKCNAEPRHGPYHGDRQRREPSLHGLREIARAISTFVVTKGKEFKSHLRKKFLTVPAEGV